MYTLRSRGFLSSFLNFHTSAKILCKPAKKPASVSKSSAMFPVVTAQEISLISKVLSIIIVGDRVSWCSIHRVSNEKSPKLVVDSLHHVGYKHSPRMHFLTLLKEMEIIAEQLPESDLYLVEEYPGTAPTPFMFKFHLQMAQTRSMLLGLIKSRRDTAKFISIKTISVAKLFNTYIGSEKVSGQSIVENIFNTETSSSLTLSDAAIENYKSADVKVKEGLSQAFLLNFAYWKLTRQIK